MRSGLPTSSPPPPQRLIVSFACSPPAVNISMWTWEDYRWFVTGEAARRTGPSVLLVSEVSSGADGAAFRWNHRPCSRFEWWSLRALLFDPGASSKVEE